LERQEIVNINLMHSDAILRGQQHRKRRQLNE